MARLWSTETEDCFAIIMKVVCGLIMRKLRAGLRSTCSTVCTASLRLKEEIALVSSCISQCTKIIWIGQGNGRNAAITIAYVISLLLDLHSSVLRMEAVYYCRRSLFDHKIIRCHKSEGQNLNDYCALTTLTDLLLLCVQLLALGICCIRVYGNVTLRTLRDV
jgi:hypothetical protein